MISETEARKAFGDGYKQLYNEEVDGYEIGSAPFEHIL